MMKVADIIAVQGVGWLSDNIRALTGGGPVSHVALVQFVGPRDTFIIQAVSPCVRISTLPDELASVSKAWCLSLPSLTDEQRMQIVNAGMMLLGRPYNYWDILMQFMDSETRSTWYTETWGGDYAQICSMADTIAYDAAGVRLGNPEDVTPNGIWAIAQSPPAGWAWGPWTVEIVK